MLVYGTGKKCLDSKGRSFCRATQESLEVANVFTVARDFRRRCTLRRRWAVSVESSGLVFLRGSSVRSIPFELAVSYDIQDSRVFSCCRFSLQTRRGGLVKIYDSALMSGVSHTLSSFQTARSVSSSNTSPIYLRGSRISIVV